MSAVVINIFDGKPTNLDPDMVLENLKGELTGFVLAGYGPDGSEFFSSTYSDGPEALWLLERCKRALLSHGDPQ